MKKHSKIVLCALLVLSLLAGTTGTIAYLQDSDSDVNVMTLGKVEIDQLEYERVQKADGSYEMIHSDKYNDDGYKLQEYTQEKPLLPAVGTVTGYGEAAYFDQLGAGASGGQKVLAGIQNVQDKFVLVKNTGKSDAYVRTLIAYEAGTAEGVMGNPGGAESNLIMPSHGGNWQANEIGLVAIKGNNYFVTEYVYTGNEDRHTGGILPPGEYTYNSLAQVYMSPRATNEDVEAIDGNDNGTYDILVLSQAVQADGFADAQTALDISFGEATDKDNLIAWFTGVWEDATTPPADTWDGTADISWYNDTATEFVIEYAEDLAGLAELVDSGKTFEGKTVKLGKNIDLKYVPEGANESKCFEPIGSYRKDTPFKGTFDGQGHTISNMSQNTWDLDNGYYYGDLGLGLFGNVEDATIKNLVMDGASISGESAMCGTVAAAAFGDCTFENITVKNSKVLDYQYYAGGIVGWASGDHKYINCDVDATTTVGGQWGDFDNSNGGLIGGCGGSATILLKDCNVAARIDAYNDVTSTYQWYAYRRSGMLIGNTGKTETVNETTYAAAPQLTCENVTVTYGDWANYTYCEFAGTSWPYVRVQAGESNSAYSNPRYGHPTDANGTTVVDDNHVHNDGEDHQILCVFDQLYGGGQGVYGDSTHDGVTVIYNNK